jgi:rod shape-determining protein MreD
MVSPVRKVLILILFFYILALFQTSFLVHFRVINFILILVIFINLFERAEENFGLFSALIGGFFLDIFSQRPLGFHILVLLLLVFLIKMVLKRYIQLPFFK